MLRAEGRDEGGDNALDVTTSFIGIKQSIMTRTALILLDTPFVYVAVIGFSIVLALVLSIIYAWQYSARKGGKELG